MDKIPKLSPSGAQTHLVWSNDSKRPDIVDLAFRVAGKTLYSTTQNKKSTTEENISDLSDHSMHRHILSPPSLQRSIDVDPRKYDPSQKMHPKNGMMSNQADQAKGRPDSSPDPPSTAAVPALSRHNEWSLSPIYEPLTAELDRPPPSFTYGDYQEKPERRHPLSTATMDGKFPRADLPEADLLKPFKPAPEALPPMGSDRPGEMSNLDLAFPQPARIAGNSPKTVYSDPRARNLPFMQATSDGWTAHIDDYIHSRDTSIKDAQPATRVSQQNHFKQEPTASSGLDMETSLENSPPFETGSSHFGLSRIQKTFQERVSPGSTDLNKSLPSPPLDAFSPEVRGRLGLIYGSQVARHRRAETAPSVPTPQAAVFDEVTPRLTAEAAGGVRVYGSERGDVAPFLSPAALRREGSPTRRGPSYDTASSRMGREFEQQHGWMPKDVASLNLPRAKPVAFHLPLHRQPSRMDRFRETLSRSPERLRERLGRSPERRVGERNRSLSGFHAAGRASPERRGRSPVRRERSLGKTGVSPIRYPEYRGFLQSSTGNERSSGAETSYSSHGHRSNQPSSQTSHPELAHPGVRVDESPRMTQLPETMQGNQDKLWGERGVLSRPAPSPAKHRSPSRPGKRSISLKGVTERLFHSAPRKPSTSTSCTSRSRSPSAVPAAPAAARSPSAPLSSHGRFPISVPRAEQMRLFSELEYLLQTLANNFLLDQLDGHRLSAASIRTIARKWANHGRAQTIDFHFDLRTQLELVQLNLQRVHFHGAQAASSHRRFCLLYAWKDIARELAVRSFCAADSAVKKMLSDCYIVLDMLGAPGAYWLILQKLHVAALERIKGADDARRARRELSRGVGVARLVVPGSPVGREDGDERAGTRRMGIERRPFG